MRLEATLKDKALFGRNEGQSLKQKCQKMFLKIDQSKISFFLGPAINKDERFVI